MERVNKLIESISIPPQLEREKIMPIVSIVAATAILYSTYKLVSNSNKKKNGKKQGLKDIPSPASPYPYVGHMFSLGSSPGRQITEWHKELGHIFKLRMGIQTWILIDDPLLAHKIFVTHGAEASNRPHSTFAYEYYSLKGK